MQFEENAWHPFDGGATVGGLGSELGILVRDDEHSLGARIALERAAVNAPFAITCGIYGWMFHTSYLGGESEANQVFDQMKDGLTAILYLIPRKDDPASDSQMKKVCDAIQSFVDQFP